MVRVAHLSPADAELELADIEAKLQSLASWRKRLTGAIRAVQKEIDALPAQAHRVRHDWNQFEELTEALDDLRNGVHSRRDGQSIHIPFEITGRPGLRDIKGRVARLTAKAAALREHMARWPDDSTTHPYTYVGTALAFFDDRELAHGDVVQLTRTQAVGWADRFIPTSTTTTTATDGPTEDHAAHS